MTFCFVHPPIRICLVGENSPPWCTVAYHAFVFCVVPVRSVVTPVHALIHMFFTVKHVLIGYRIEDIVSLSFAKYPPLPAAIEHCFA